MALLTQKEIVGLKPKTSSYYKWDGDRTRGAGKLGIKVFASGNKSYVYRFFRNEKATFIQLGKFPEMSLAEARDKAKLYGAQLKEGKDPKEMLEQQKLDNEQKRQAEMLTGSIELLFKSYTSHMKKNGKRTHAQVLRELEKEVYPHVPPHTKAKEVTPHQIKIILAHMIRRGAPVQSNRVRSYLMAAFNYGLNHDNDPANFVVV